MALVVRSEKQETIMVSQIGRLLPRIIALAALTLSIALLPATLRAQNPELVAPMSAASAADTTPDQIQRLDQIRQRPSTASATLVRINVDALRGDNTQVSVAEGRTLVFSKRSMDIRTDRDFTWSGSLVGVPGDATLVVR